MKKRLCYLSIVIIYMITFLGCSIGIDKTKDEGIALLKEKNYAGALSKFNEVLSEDAKNSDAITLKKLTENCIVLTDKYNSNDFPSVIQSYDKIKLNPSFNLVNADINNMYNDAKKKPNLKLKYLVYDSDEFEKNTYYEDGKGELLLASRKKYELDENAFEIDSTRPLTEVFFQIENTGMNPAEAVVLNFKFNHMAVNFTPGNKWVGVSNLHGLGLWNEVKFIQNNEPLYKDIPIKFTFDFKGSIVGSDANIEVTLLAKDCTPKKFTIPVKVKQF